MCVGVCGCLAGVKLGAFGAPLWLLLWSTRSSHEKHFSFFILFCLRFEEARSFEQDVSNFKTHHVVSMSAMFSGATSFTGAKGSMANWKVEKVTRMDRMQVAVSILYCSMPRNFHMPKRTKLTLCPPTFTPTTGISLFTYLLHHGPQVSKCYFLSRRFVRLATQELSPCSAHVWKRHSVPGRQRFGTLGDF